MNEITRIHIAKTPYSIELGAKKELQAYLQALESYTSDHELLNDIEIRITELLLERDIKEGDVISSSDITAISEQLGDPKEFMTDDAAIGTTEPASEKGLRKLYRNVDNALVGGVLSGIASYVGINAWWARLAFVIALFASFGLAVLVYIAAWLIVPAARTSAEKLQMSGRPVTLSSIREVLQTQPSIATERRIARTKRVLTILLGIGAVLVALGAIAMMLIVTLQLLLGQDIDASTTYRVPLVLFFISGALLTVLAIITAIAAFAQKFNKRIWISALVITVLGLTSFSAAITTGYIQERSQYETLQREMTESSRPLPAAFADVKSLTVDIPEHVNFTYVVDPSNTVKQRLHRDASEAKLSVENGTATISLPESAWPRYGTETEVTIYGPALESITTKNGRTQYENATQPSLIVTASGSSAVVLSQARIDSLTATLNHSAQLDAEGASVADVKLELADRSGATLGNIASLSLKSPGVCASDATAELKIEDISSNSFELNGKQTNSRSFEVACLSVEIGGAEREEE